MAQQVSKGHGRLEKRPLTARSGLSADCRAELGWTSGAQVLRLERWVTKPGWEAARMEGGYGMS